MKSGVCTAQRLSGERASSKVQSTIPRTYIKSPGMATCEPVTPVLGRQRRTDPWGLTGQLGQLFVPRKISRFKIRQHSWGRTAVYSLVSTHSRLHMPKHTKQKGKLQSIYIASSFFYLEYKLEINDKYWTSQRSASNRVTRSSMRQRQNLIGRGRGKEREEAGGRTKCFREGEENLSKLREALFNTGSPSEGSKQMQTTQNGGSALRSRSGLNICTCPLEATRQHQQTQAHPLLPSDTTASRNYLELCLNQVFRASHGFGKRECEAKVRKFKQTYYFPFKLKYIS